MESAQRLAALEKMVYPKSKLTEFISAAIDKIGNTIKGSNEKNPTQSIPRETYPKILFIWGLSRILPVIIESMSINELQYDCILNPIQAEVEIGLAINSSEISTDDKIAIGALNFSDIALDTQAALNLATTSEQIVDLIPF